MDGWMDGWMETSAQDDVKNSEMQRERERERFCRPTECAFMKNDLSPSLIYITLDSRLEELLSCLLKGGRKLKL